VTKSLKNSFKHGKTAQKDRQEILFISLC